MLWLRALRVARVKSRAWVNTCDHSFFLNVLWEGLLG